MPGAELGPGVESRAKPSRVPAVLKLIVWRRSKMSQSSNHAKTRKISAVKVGEGEACRAKKAHSTRLGFSGEVVLNVWPPDHQPQEYLGTS